MKAISFAVAALLLAGCASPAQQAAEQQLGAPRAAPSEAALAAAPLLQSQSSPWAERPSARHFMAAYPSQALQQGVDGSVGLECLVEDDYAVACLVRSETPRAAGFAEAALSMTPLLRVAPTLDGHETRGARLYWDVNFVSSGRYDLTGSVPFNEQPSAVAQQDAQ